MRSERLFQTSWFVKEDNARIIQPTIINLPRFRLGHHLQTHYGVCRKQSQKTELGYPAETKARVLTQSRKPTRSDSVVDMPLRREGDPDIHIREKE